MEPLKVLEERFTIVDNRQLSVGTNVRIEGRDEIDQISNFTEGWLVCLKSGGRPVEPSLVTRADPPLLPRDISRFKHLSESS